MILYSHNGKFPTRLPNRIKLSDGTTRTDSSTFTEEEIADAGWSVVDNPPSVTYPNKLTWNSIEGWVISEPTALDIAKKWETIREWCQDELAKTDYKVIKALEAGVALDEEYVTYRQEIRDLHNNVNDVDPWSVVYPSAYDEEI